MRILALQETDWIERNPILHHRMLESLSARGADVTVIDFQIGWAKKGWRPIRQPRTEIAGSRKLVEAPRLRLIRPGMIRLPGLARLTWLVGNWREVRRIISHDRPDVVVAYGISNALIGLILARQNRIRFVYHLLDALHTLAEPSFLRPIARIVEAAVIRGADRLIVINKALEGYTTGMGADPARVEVIPAGRDPSSETALDDPPTRRELGAREGDLLLLFIGWLYTFSGLSQVIAELGRRRNAFAGTRLVIVGDGDALEDLSRMRTELGLEEQVLLTGRRPASQIPRYITAADVCLLPALKVAAMQHIVPAKIGEYMEHGKPVIATRLPGLEAEFGDLEGMLYIDRPEEVWDVVASLRAEQRPRGTARDLGGSCLRFVRSREDWDEVTSRFERVLAGG